MTIDHGISDFIAGRWCRAGWLKDPLIDKQFKKFRQKKKRLHVVDRVHVSLIAEKPTINAKGLHLMRAVVPLGSFKFHRIEMASSE